MTFKKFGIILLLIFSILPINKAIAQDPNTGFVSGNIWYSKDPFEEGDKIRIYTFIYNPDDKELSGTVIFFDKTVMLGKKNFVIPGKTANDVYIDWTATVGDHAIFGKIENAKFLISKGNYEDTYLSSNESEKSLRTVSKKIIPKSSEDTSANFLNTSVSDISKTIEEKTPNFISEPIVSTVNSLEAFRNNLNTTSENKKEKIKAEIKTLADTKTTSSTTANKTTSKTISAPSQLLKPFKYVELFLFSVFSFVLDNGIMFYGLIIIFLFFIFRYIWNKIF